MNPIFHGVIPVIHDTGSVMKINVQYTTSKVKRVNYNCKLDSVHTGIPIRLNWGIIAVILNIHIFSVLKFSMWKSYIEWVVSRALLCLSAVSFQSRKALYRYPCKFLKGQKKSISRHCTKLYRRYNLSAFVLTLWLWIGFCLLTEGSAAIVIVVQQGQL